MVTCSFLGNSYSFSPEVFDLHAIYSHFSKEQTILLSVLEKNIRSKEKPGIPDDKGNDEIVDALRTCATKLVSSLCDKGIVSYTISDFLDKNPAYTKYNELSKSALDAYLQILLDNLNSFMSNAMSARDSASATIVGSNTGIITNSISSFLLYNAIEYKTISNQIASAESM